MDLHDDKAVVVEYRVHYVNPRTLIPKTLDDVLRD